MLQLDAVSKRFGQTVAVDGLSLTVHRGEVLGLLGPNGAGKSTTVGLTVGLLAPDSGRVVIDNADPRTPATRRRIGVATQAVALYEMLSAVENLRFFGQIYGLDGSALDARVAWALDFVGLSDRRRDRVDTYSGGMKRRLNLAAAVIHDPEIVLLDEPTVGVDPQSRNQIFDNIAELKRSGRTIIYTTHYMEEAERLCDRVAIIDHGTLLALGTVPELLTRIATQATLIVSTVDGERRIETGDPLGELNRIAATTRVIDFHLDRPTLEQVFLHLTGRRLRD